MEKVREELRKTVVLIKIQRKHPSTHSSPRIKIIGKKRKKREEVGGSFFLDLTLVLDFLMRVLHILLRIR